MVVSDVAHLAHIDSREPVFADWPTWLPETARQYFVKEGITHPWFHQIEAATLAHQGNHIVLATGTASGKSLVYQMLGLTAILEGRTGSALHGHRDPTVLYISPTKALAADQLAHLPSSLTRAVKVDGDSTREDRIWARNHANWVLTNPDTLHHVMLPGHDRWSRFFRGLRYVVVDESHHYRGVFGAHIAHILRRLRRIATHYGAEPVFILSSATIGQPQRVAEALTGLRVHEITEDRSGRGAKTIALIEPSLIDNTDPPIRRSAYQEAARLLAQCVANRISTLCFVPSRRQAELITVNAQRILQETEPGLVNRVATYRGGYLPEDRRTIEKDLREGRLLGLASTNALELGIDIAGLDCVITVGFPGTRAALFQQFGRAGRSGKESLGILVARDDPLDAYFVHHPEALLGTRIETNVFDPDNPYVLGPHLAAAAQEMPLTKSDFELFGHHTTEGVAALVEAGYLRERPSGWYWTKLERASQLADIRSSGPNMVTIVESGTGTVIGTVDSSSADSTVHEGAVYVHQGETFLVTDFDHSVALVERQELGYHTMARSTSSVSIVDTEQTISHGGVTTNFGTIDVTNQVTSFIRRLNETHEVMGEEPLHMPEHSLRTKAIWFTIDDHLVKELAESGNLAGAAHGAEHAAIGILPLLATCDRWDIGGLSTTLHPDTAKLTIFIYDGFPGGAGFAEFGFKDHRSWLEMTHETIQQCACEAGCPSCIHSPKCGNGNEPLHKAGALSLLEILLQK